MKSHRTPAVCATVLLCFCFHSAVAIGAQSPPNPAQPSPPAPQPPPTAPAPEQPPAQPPAPAVPPQFQIECDPKLQATPYAGRILVILARDGDREPRRRINSFAQWIRPTPVFGKSVKDWDVKRPLEVGADADHYPFALNELPREKFVVQAVARRNLDFPEPGVSPGDLYSDPIDLDLTTYTGGPISLRLVHAVDAPQPPQHPRLKTVEMVSPLLSKFFGREVKTRAWVRLPEGFSETDGRTYPVLYSISGFGGGPPRFESMGGAFARSPLLEQVLLVVPDSRCYRGHHVFADSENNGPRGRAFVEELIPLIEKTCHGAQSPKHRYVTGMSSGGWSSLWLQVTYPDVFNGCWSDVPDPVDFRDFQRIDLTQPGANLYKDASGARRPLMRQGEQVMVYYEDFARAEAVLGPGGQLHSFEAVFSPRGRDGEPAPLFDRKTGAVDAAVAKSWERYDIRLVLERNWATLGPKLSGKLHIRAGEFDNFYLEGAARLLKETLTKMGSDADVEIVAGAGHGTLFGPPAVAMLETIVGNFRKEFPEPASPVVADPAVHSPQGAPNPARP